MSPPPPPLEPKAKRQKRAAKGSGKSNSAAASGRCGGGESENNQGNTSRTLGLTGLPTTCLVKSLNYLENDDMLNATLVCKRLRDGCRQPGIENEISPVIEIKRAVKQDPTTIGLLEKLQRRQSEMGEEYVRRYRHMRIREADRFYDVDQWNSNIGPPPRFDRILSLELCPSTLYRSGEAPAPSQLLISMADVLPNLREIDISNFNFLHRPGAFNYMSYITRKCPLLEKVTCNHSPGLNMTGLEFRGATNLREIHMVTGLEFRGANNLREIHMDDHTFCVPHHFRRDQADDDDDDNATIFGSCIQTLERVSIRNSKVSLVFGDFGLGSGKSLSQSSLVKFVRNCPNLRWFRSDLSKENIDLLRSERPGIEFLN